MNTKYIFGIIEYDQIPNKVRNRYETQEHLELCDGTAFERKGLDLSDWRGKLEFWRRMTKKMATVT